MAIEIKGMEELDRKLKELGRDVASEAFKKALPAGARILLEDMKRRVPVRTGKLRASLDIGNPRASQKKVILKIGSVKVSGAYYGRFIEYGTSKMPAKPFMRPALDARGKEAIEAVGDDLWDDIENRVRYL